MIIHSGIVTCSRIRCTFQVFLVRGMKTLGATEVYLHLIFFTALGRGEWLALRSDPFISSMGAPGTTE